MPLAVLHRGEILDGISVDVVMSGLNGCRQWQEMVLDGALALRVTESGRYLAIGRYQVRDGEKDGCDDLLLTATLAFLVAK